MNDKVAFLLDVPKTAILPENAEEIITKVTQVVDILARSTYQSVCVLDVIAQKYLYISDNPLMLCGMTPEEAMKTGFAFYADYVPKEDLKLMHKVSRLGWGFYNSLPPEERKDYTLSYCYHLHCTETPLLITQRMNPLVCTQDGQTWLSLSVFDISPRKSAGHVTMRHKGTNEVWIYDLDKEEWIKRTPVVLSDVEKSIVVLSAQGYTMDEIAGKIMRSVDTVKFHKRRLFKKLDVKSTTEALAVAVGSKLI